MIPEPADEIAFIYDQTVLRTFELRLAEADLAAIDADPTAERYVPGTLVFESIEYPVSIRYKGSVGAWVGCTEDSTDANPLNVGGAKTCPKLNLKVSFNETDPNGRFFGVKKLLFHAMNLDASLMRERLAYWLFRQMGVAAPRAVHVRLLINGELAGVFVNVEYIDGRFTRSRFADGGGNLYKEVWPTWSRHTPELNTPRLRGALRTNEDDNPTFSRILAYSRAVMARGSDARASAIQQWMSVENTMRFVAVDRTIGVDDGPFHFYCRWGCENHNFYIYEEQLADRVWLIPWDLDNAFVVPGTATQADTFLTIVDQWDDVTVPCQPHPGAAPWTPYQLPPSCDPLFNGCACYFQSEFRQAVGELLDGPFSQATIAEQLEIWSAQIAGAVDEAHATDPDQLPPEDWRAGLADLEQRTATLRARAVSHYGE
jgi:spore coat protein CotH